MANQKKAKKKTTSNAVEILYKRLLEGKPEMQAMLAEEETRMDITEQICSLRIDARLTQNELAEKIGTTASVICRLENADYEGHSLSMLHRIATALNQRVKISFVPQSGVPVG